MDKHAIQFLSFTLAIVFSILGSMWYLKTEISEFRTELRAEIAALDAKVETKIAALDAKIADNRDAITAVQVQLAELSGILQGRGQGSS